MEFLEFLQMYLSVFSIHIKIIVGALAVAAVGLILGVFVLGMQWIVERFRA